MRPVRGEPFGEVLSLPWRRSLFRSLRGRVLRDGDGSGRASFDALRVVGAAGRLPALEVGPPFGFDCAALRELCFVGADFGCAMLRAVSSIGTVCGREGPGWMAAFGAAFGAVCGAAFVAAGWATAGVEGRLSAGVGREAARSEGAAADGFAAVFATVFATVFAAVFAADPLRRRLRRRRFGAVSVGSPAFGAVSRAAGVVVSAGWAVFPAVGVVALVGWAVSQVAEVVALAVVGAVLRVGLRVGAGGVEGWAVAVVGAFGAVVAVAAAVCAVCAAGVFRFGAVGLALRLFLSARA